jgi:hypothetical protein
MPSSASGGATGVRSRARMHGPHCRSRRWCVQIRLAGPAWQFARGSWRVVPLVKPASTLLKRAWISQAVRPRARSVQRGTPIALREWWRLATCRAGSTSGGRRSGFSRLGSTKRDTPRRPGSITPVSALRSRRRSWATRRRTISRVRRRSPFAATRTRCRVSSSGPATCWISSSRVGARQTSARDLAEVSSQAAFGPQFNALRISLRFRSLTRSPERFAPLYTGVFGLYCTASKTVVGGFVHRGFESHPLRCRPDTMPASGRVSPA